MREGHRTISAPRTHPRPHARRSHLRLLRRQHYLEALEPRTLLAGTWTPLLHTAPSGLNSAVLLTDGRVLFQIAGTSNRWATLTPTSTGSYINGTWANVASSTFTRLDDSTQVLQNGNVYLSGGEYGTGGSATEIYNPFTNTWSPGPTQNFGKISDASSMLLPNGNVLQYVVGAATTTIYNVSTNTFSAAIPILAGRNLDEQTWVKLPDDSILTPDGEFSNTKTSERFIPALNQWIADASYPNTMIDGIGEAGPAFMLPDGRAFFMGATGQTNFYTPSGTNAPGTWTAGPPVPNGLGIDDGNGAMLADGTILFTAGTPNTFNGPVSMFIFDPVGLTYTAVPNVPAAITNAAPYYEYMIDLPDGTVLMTAGSAQAYVYNPNVTPLPAAVPVISSIAPKPGGSYLLTGTGLNGLGVGAVYGDDNQMDTNYPIVRLTNGSNVYYATTTFWSTTSIQTGDKPETVTFTPPAGIPNGTYNVVSVANGVPSGPVSLTINNVKPTVATAAGATPNPVTGTTAALSVLGADVNGEAGLTYTWSVSSKPAGATTPAFSINGTNDAKNTTATFFAAGNYTFVATITEAPGVTATSSVSVTVSPIASGFSISPSSVNLVQYSTQQFTAAAIDQFGNPLPSQPAFTWNLAGVGSLGPSGLYSAAFSGTGTIIAQTGTTSLSATVHVVAPLVWLRNDSISASPTAVDSSGNNFNGAITGTFGSTYSSAAGKINGALNLSSTTNTAGYVTLPGGFASSIQSATEFTVMAWVNLTTLNNWARLFDFNGNNTTKYMFLAPADGSGLPRFAITTGSGAGEKVVQGNTAVSTGSWHQLAFTLAGSTGTIYLDGVSIGSAGGITINPSTMGLTARDYIGKSAYGADPNLNGIIDDFRFYPAAIGAAGIASMYNLGLNAASHMPAVAATASAGTPLLTGRTSTLSVLGGETAGENNLLYVWSTTGSPPAAVNFSANGTNAAKFTTATFTKVGTYNFNVTIADALGYTVTSSTSVTVSSAVVGRYLFYRNSSFDSPSDNAIAPDKSPLLPGQTATFANYSSYSLGINGIMLDYAGPAINFFATDFVFNVGNNSTPASWIGASAPVSVTVRPGAGVGGSTRIEIAWIDATIQQQWLQITFKGGAGATSGLDASDVFYFGNAIAESGNSPTDTKVDAIDQLAPRAGATTGALITNPLDYDRDGIVGSQDEVIARNCFTYFINQLQLITPPGPPPAPPAAAALPILAPAQPLGGVGRTFSLAPLSSTAISGEWFPLARIKRAPPAKKIHLAVIKPPTRKLS